MKKLVTLFIFISCSIVNADFQQLATELSAKKMEVQKQIDPLIQEASDQELKIQGVKEELRRLEEGYKQIQMKNEKLKTEDKSVVTRKMMSDILAISKIGDCEIRRGSVENEFFITDKDGTIRIVFASEESPRRPEAQLFSKNDQDFIKIVQKDYDPQKPTLATGPMLAVIVLDVQKLIVHAQFRGEGINDKGPFGLLGSSHKPRGITCKSMDLPDLL